jgi:exodeoxyribonuclease V gamma subunit
MLRVYHSNRLERLFDRLTEILAEPIADPLAPEMVVTQSQGMARWLALHLAERTGIAANIRFTLPAAFVWRTFVDQLQGLADNSAFDRRVLAWRLLGALPDWLGHPAFAPLAHYVDGPRPELRRWQLCRQIADVFDQYLIYRPDLLLEWERGEGDEWQAHLWRSLARAADSTHRAALWREFLARCDQGLLDRAKLPERLVIFGIPTLPPAYLEVVRRLAEVVDVHLLVLNPCLLYWGDIEEPRNIARLRKARAPLKGDDYYNVGNPLLASLGRQGRDFIDLLHELPVEEEEMFEAPDEETLLDRLHSDILLLADRGRGDPPPVALADDDHSIQIHSCHSPMREVEVLHDQLLALFEADATLRPQDVIVMTPNIEEYAPFVEAVFGAARGAHHIPYAIADLSRQSEHPVVQAFMQLLETATGRYTASDVLSLLEVPAVLRRFNLTPDDYDTIRQWVAESGIRWGLDGRSRGQWCLPEHDANSWEFGFRRLFLGYALPPDEEQLFAGVFPYPHVEGQSAAALGRLRGFIERLAHAGTRLRGSYTASQWSALIHELIDGFFDAEGDDADPLQILRDAASALVDEAERARYGTAFGLDLVRDFFQGQLSDASPGQNFLTGRVTFCAMIPMRSVPFRVVCLLGLGDQSFPRTRRPLGFDKMAANPRRGDRSRREDDRYLFLEALLSARDRFYVSYVGRNIRDNSLLLPSVLVTELIDYVAAATPGDGKALRARLTTEHPLQPFSHRYFDGADPRLFSHADEWLAGLHARARQGEAATFFTEPLAPLPDDEPIEVAALVQFFKNPAAALLRDRLGMRFEHGEEVLEDSEPFTLEGLASWSLKSELLESALHDRPLDQRLALVAARGDLPVGAFGHLCFERDRAAVEPLAEEVRPHLSSPLPPLEFSLVLGTTRLQGWIHHRTRGGLLRWRAAKLNAWNQLELWIHHLALNAMQPGDGAAVSRLFAEDKSITFGPVDDAAAHLQTLVDLYREGMRAPLPFMPLSAGACAEACGDNPDDALEKARRRWERDGYGQRGEALDPWCNLAFRGRDPLDERFREIACAVFAPLLAAREEA